MAFLRFLSDTPDSYRDTNYSIRQRLTLLMEEWHMDPSLLGVEYTKQALEICDVSPLLLEDVVKGLLPAIAEKVNSTPSRVERNIRHMITSTYYLGNKDFRQSFPNGTPTVSEFLSRIYIILNNEDDIAKLLFDLGLNPALLGFKYVRTAVEVLNEQPNLKYNICQGLYAKVALAHSTTASRVERGIRHSIEVASHPMLNTYDCFCDMFPKKPSNSEFISKLYEVLHFYDKN